MGSYIPIEAIHQTPNMQKVLLKDIWGMQCKTNLPKVEAIHGTPYVQ